MPQTPPKADGQSVEQLLRRSQVTSFTEELDLSFATDLTAQALGVLCECMPKLKRLTVHGAGLRELPEAICTLRDLRELNASNNHLTGLPTKLAMAINLQHLNLAKNELVELPPTVGAMPGLRLLNANNNKLVRLPDNFGLLGQLRVLRLGANVLEGLPQSFAQLSGLRLLQLGHNQMSQFPPALARLDRLSVLDLSHNRLTGLPDFLRAMSSLATLNVTGNPLKAVPTALALPQELKITGIYSLLEGAEAAPSAIRAASKQPSDSDRTHPNIRSLVPGAERPDFNGPQGQIDVTGIFLAGLLPGINDLDDKPPSNKKS